MLSLRSSCCILTALTLAAPLFAADSVTKKSGGKVAGKITGTTKTDITVKPQVGDAVTVPANDVASVDWEDAGVGFNLIASEENNGRFDAALQKLNDSKSKIKAPNENLSIEYNFLAARIQARQALADPSKRENAIKALQAVQKETANHFRYYETISLLGQVQLASQDFAGARSTYEQLAQAPWNDTKLAAKIANGRILMGENKPEEAVKVFDEAVASAGDSSAEKARRNEAILGRARAYIMESKHEQALKDLDEVINKASADDTPVQAEAYVLQGNSLAALGRNKEACVAYLHVDILFPRESAYHAEALYHMAKLWKTVQSPDRSLEAEAKLQSSYPNSEWTKKLSAPPGE